MSPRWHGQPQRVLTAFTAAGTATKFGGVTNLPSIWNFVPNVTFSVGVTATFPTSGTYQSNLYVTDPENDTITLTKNSVFVQGVTWNGGVFITNGTGSATTSTGHILTANDGRGHFVDSSSFQIALVTTAAVEITSSGNRVLLTDDTSEGPDTTYASRLLGIPWENATTGDWRDANDTAQGTSYFATVAVPSVVGAPTAFNFTGSGMLSLIARLRADNTGIYVKKRAGGSGVSWALKENTTAAYRPVLTLVTSIGTLTPTNLADSSILPGQGAQGAAVASGGGAPVLKFDLSALVIGVTVSSATLTLTTVNVSGNIGVSNWDVYYLDMPRFVTNPAAELGGVELGIAATLADDTDLETHGSVIVYDKFESDSDINNGDWWWQDRFVAGYHASPAWATDYSYGTWDDGIGYARVTAPMTGSSASFMKLLRVVYPDTWHNSIRPGLDNPLVPPNRPWSRTWANIEVGTYEEMYLRYLIEFEDDVEGGLNHQAMLRMPRLSNIIEDLGNGITPEAMGMQFSYAPFLWSHSQSAAERSSPSTHPNVFNAGLYEYDHENPTTGSGFPQRFESNFCWETGRRYTIEQYVKFNTWNGQGTAYDNDPSHWNADGIIRMWVDGVRVLDVTNRKIRVNAKNKIFLMPWGEFYETTGGNPPGAHTDHHIKIGSMVVSTAYVGPPQTAPLWARNATLNTWIDVPGETRLSTVSWPATTGSVLGTSYPMGSSFYNAWSGPSFSRRRGEMIWSLGGGHNDGFANVSWQFNLLSETPSISLLDPGTTNLDLWYAQSSYYGDLKPAALHTYNHRVFCDQRDWDMCFGSAYADGPGLLNPAPGGWAWDDTTYATLNPFIFSVDPNRSPRIRQVYVFDRTAGSWQAPGTVADVPTWSNGLGAGGAPSATVMDYRTGDVFLNWSSESNAKIHKWVAASNTWADLPSNDVFASYDAWAVDEPRNVIWQCGHGTTSNELPAVYDLATGTRTLISYTGNATEISDMRTRSGNYSYAQYDRGLGAILVCVTGTTNVEVYKVTYVNATTYSVEKLALSNAPANPTNGIVTRFQYSPLHGGVFLWTAINQHVKFCRTGAPQPA